MLQKSVPSLPFACQLSLLLFMNPTLQLIVTRSQFPDTSDLPELSLFVITHLYSSLFHSPRPSSNTTNSRNVLWSNFFSMNTEYIWFVHQQRDKEDKKYVINTQVYTCVGLPWWLRWWRIRLQRRRPGFDPWVGKISWRREWLLTPVFVPREFHGQRSLAWVAKSWTLQSD